MVKFSIIIPVSKPNKNLEEAIAHCKEINYPSYEIIVLPDENAEIEGVEVVPTGHLPPSEKRDIALKHAKGEILAFLDDDAYPTKDWLKNAEKYFEDENVAAIGGPAITPPNDSALQKASGEVFSSFLGGGNYAYRYVPMKTKEVDDYPTVNLFVRKKILEKIGGFDTKYWPGEDTKLCLDIIKLGKKIIYAPDVVVYHHRRKLFIPHLKQVWSYSVHRGFFAKKFPETSLRPSYFIPTVFVAGLVLGLPLSIISQPISIIYSAVILLYLIVILITSVKSMKQKLMPLVFVGLIASHITYGIGFVRGLLARELKR